MFPESMGRIPFQDPKPCRCRKASNAPRLLDSVRDRIRIKHYSLRTEQAYVDWIRRFIRFGDNRPDLGAGASEIEASSPQVKILAADSPRNHVAPVLGSGRVDRAILLVDGNIKRPDPQRFVFVRRSPHAGTE